MWNEEQIAGLAEISESDRQAAAAYARRHLSPRYRPMLDAQGGLPSADDSDWEWAALLLGVWLFKRQPTPQVEIERQLARLMAALATDVHRVSSAASPVGSWALAMLTLSKQSHLLAAAVAQGGWAMLDRAALAAVEAAVADEAGYLGKFADDVAAGRVPRDGRYVRRAMLYGMAGWGFYYVVRGRIAGSRGYDEERNVLGAAEHCSGCLDETARDWQPVGTLVPVGGRQCRSNCRCHLEFRNSRTGETA